MEIPSSIKKIVGISKQTSAEMILLPSHVRKVLKNIQRISNSFKVPEPN